MKPSGWQFRTKSYKCKDRACTGCKPSVVVRWPTSFCNIAQTNTTAWSSHPRNTSRKTKNNKIQSKETKNNLIDEPNSNLDKVSNLIMAVTKCLQKTSKSIPSIRCCLKSQTKSKCFKKIFKTATAYESCPKMKPYRTKTGDLTSSFQGFWTL